MARPIYAVLLGLLLLAGCAGKPQPVASPRAEQTPTSSDAAEASDESDGTGQDAPDVGDSTSDITDNPPGKLACKSLSDAVQAATLMNPGVVDGIIRASGTADAPVADAAQRLASAYATAVKSHGTDSEPDAIAAVSMAGAEMTKICQESGLDAAG